MAFTKTKKAAAKQAHKKGKKAETAFQKAYASAGPLFTEVSKDARKRAEVLYSDLSPRVQKQLAKGIAESSARLAELQALASTKFDESLGPRARQFRSDVESDYLPRARRTADATNTTLAAAIGAAVEAARTEFEKGAPAIRTAATTSPVKDKRKSKIGTAFVVLGVAAVAGAAGYVAWQKTRPVEDPWAPPADFARSHYPAAGVNDAETTQVSDSVATADAGDVTGSLTDESKTNTHKGA